MSLMTASVVGSVLVINVHFRSPSSHEMSKHFRVIVMEFLPKLLNIKRPSPNKNRQSYFRELMDFFDVKKREEARKYNPMKRYFVQQENFTSSKSDGEMSK